LGVEKRTLLTQKETELQRITKGKGGGMFLGEKQAPNAPRETKETTPKPPHVSFPNTKNGKKANLPFLLGRMNSSSPRDAKEIVTHYASSGEKQTASY